MLRCASANCAKNAMCKQMLCAPCFHDKWGPEPQSFQFAPWAWEILAPFLVDDHINWVTSAFDNDDFALFRSLLPISFNNDAISRNVLRLSDVFARPHVSDKHGLKFYLIDRFMHNEFEVWTEHITTDQITNEFPLAIALLRNLDLANALPAKALLNDDIRMFLCLRSLYRDLSIAHLTCVFDKCPTFITWCINNQTQFHLEFWNRFLTQSKHLLDVLQTYGMLKPLSNHLIKSSLYDQTTLYNHLIIRRNDQMTDFAILMRLWQAFSDGDGKFVAKRDTEMFVEALRRRHYEFLTFLSKLSGFSVPFAALRDFINACQTTEFIDWVLESKIQCNFVLKSDRIWNRSDDASIRRLVFALLDRLPNNEQRLAFLLTQKIHVGCRFSNVFVRFAACAKWDFFCELALRYNFKSIGSDDDICAIFNYACLNGGLPVAQRIWSLEAIPNHVCNHEGAVCLPRTIEDLTDHLIDNNEQLFEWLMSNVVSQLDDKVMTSFCAKHKHGWKSCQKK